MSPVSPTPTARLRFAGACHLAESPRWDDRAQALLWVDLTAGVLWRADGSGATARPLGGAPIGMAAPRQDGGLLVAAPGGLRWVDDAGAEEGFLPVEEDWAVMRWNDGGCDPAGRLLVGTTSRVEGAAPGRLHQLGDDGAARAVLDGIGMSNGIGWSPDGRTMYHVDTAAGTVSGYDYDVATGRPGPRTSVFRVDPADGLPDGLAVDAAGLLWIALWGGSRVRRHHPDGRVVAEVRVPARYVTSCTFGGPDLRELFITTARWTLAGDDLAAEPGAGGVFGCTVEVPGTALSRAPAGVPRPHRTAHDRSEAP